MAALRSCSSFWPASSADVWVGPIPDDLASVYTEDSNPWEPDLDECFEPLVGAFVESVHQSYHAQDVHNASGPSAAASASAIAEVANHASSLGTSSSAARAHASEDYTEGLLSISGPAPALATSSSAHAPSPATDSMQARRDTQTLANMHTGSDDAMQSSCRNSAGSSDASSSDVSRSSSSRSSSNSVLFSKMRSVFAKAKSFKFALGSKHGAAVAPSP